MYGTGLDIGQKMDFKSAGRDIWVLLNPPRDEITGSPSSYSNRKKSIYRIRILKRAKKR